MPDMPEIAIHVDTLRKVYSVDPSFGDALRALLLGRLSPRGKEALAGISLQVERGTTLGVVGRNGSGKTTLLRLLAGALEPTSGTIEIRGRTAGLLELAAGIDPAFSGAENAVLLGITAGATRREMIARLPEIRDFSGLGDAFEEPVHSYSSGMGLRLAFSTAVHSEPDVLLIDEVLAVGDAFFQQSCLLRIRQLQARGCTIVLVTHDASSVMGFCDRAIWLEHGRIATAGDPGKVIREYLSARYERGAALDQSPIDENLDENATFDDEIEPTADIPNIDNRYGDGGALVEGVSLRDEASRPLVEPRPGHILKVVVTIRAIEALRAPIVGFTLRNRLGEILTATNTGLEEHPLPAMAVGDRATVEFSLRWPQFASGTFSISPSVADGSLDQHKMHDWIDNALTVEFSNPQKIYGWLKLEGVEVRRRVDRSGNR